MRKSLFIALFGASAAFAEDSCILLHHPEITPEGMFAIFSFADCMEEHRSVDTCIEKLRLTRKERRVLVCMLEQVKKRKQDADK